MSLCFGARAIRDITEQKKAEEVQRASEERYRLLLENANEAVVVAQDGAIKYVNSIAAKIMGYTVEELAST